MARFYIQIDYGSGYVTVDPQNVQSSLKIKRGEVNEYVARKELKGSFSLIGAEATAANTYFITGANYEAPIRLYENTSGGAVLKYEGWARIIGQYDYRQNVISFNSFRTNDVYTGLLAVYQDEMIGELLTSGSGYNNFALQGNSTNCNVLQGYAWGTTWTPTGNPLSLPNVGRVAVEPLGAGIVVYDNVSREIRRYYYSAPNWALATLGTSYFMPALAGNGALAAYSATQVAFVDDVYNKFYTLQMTTGTFTVLTQTFIEEISLPSLAYIGGSNRIALVDDGTKVLRTYSTSGGQVGETLSLGDISKPQICNLDPSNFRIALVDSKTSTLRCYEWSGTAWSEIGANIKLPQGYEIKITYTAVNEVNVFDAIGGYFEKYTFSGTTWTQTGTSATLTNGYMAAGASEGTYMGVIQSDTYSFSGSVCASVYSIITALLFNQYPALSISTSNGCTIDLEKTYLGDLGDLGELSSTAIPLNDYRFSLKMIFDLLQNVFQNYWYIDSGEIKFTQPNLFSSVGTNVTLPSLIATELNQRTYKDEFLISKEDIIFKNQRGSDFDGLQIDYGRVSPIIKSSSVNITTDLNYLVDTIMGTDRNFQKSGLFMIYEDVDGTIQLIAKSGTGIISGSNIKNYKFSKSQIQNDFWKDYRYANTGNITINGSASAVQDTVRNIIEFPSISVGMDQISITEFPDSIGSVIWGGGVTSWITEFSIDIETLIITISNRLLDL